MKRRGSIRGGVAPLCENVAKDRNTIDHAAWSMDYRERGSHARGVYATQFNCLFDRLWDCPGGGSSNPGLGSTKFIVACELE